MSLDRLRTLMTPKLPKWIPHVPHPKQAALLLLPQKEICFGGAAGGGKSDGILMGACQYTDVPGYSALILRRERTSLTLPGGLVPRLLEWTANTDVRYNGSDYVFQFPTGHPHLPAKITFGYLSHDKHQFRYGSSEFHFVAFEELGEFPDDGVYRFLFSRMRRPKTGPLSKIPMRMWSSTNPIGPGKQWVKERFVTGQKDIRKRVFLPSTIDDNPSLDADEYRTSLAELPHAVREALERGNWKDFGTGEYFPLDGWTYFTPENVPRGFLKEVRFWDLAASEASATNPEPAWTCGVRLGMLPSGFFIVTHVERFRGKPAEVTKRIKRTAVMDGPGVYVRMNQDPGQAGVSQIDYYRKILAGFDFDGIRESGSKETRAEPAAAQHGQGMFGILADGSGWQRPFVEETDAFPRSKFKDQADAFSAGFNFLVTAKPMRNGPMSVGPRLY